MGEVIAFREKIDNFYYIVGANNKVIGVKYDDGVDSIIFDTDKKSGNTLVRATNNKPIKSDDIKDLMIMWLALNYPCVIKWDEEI